MGYYTNLAIVLGIIAFILYGVPFIVEGSKVSPSLDMIYVGKGYFSIDIDNPSKEVVSVYFTARVLQKSVVVLELGEVELESLDSNQVIKIVSATSSVSGVIQVPRLEDAGNYTLEITFSDKYRYKQVYGVASTDFFSEGRPVSTEVS